MALKRFVADWELERRERGSGGEEQRSSGEAADRASVSPSSAPGRQG